MNELFKALNNFKATPPADNFYIESEQKQIIALCREPKDNTIKISREDFKFLLDNGIDYYLYDNGIIKKPKKKTDRIFKVLKKNIKGYSLQDNDPYWPMEIVEGGYTWQTPSE